MKGLEVQPVLHAFGAAMDPAVSMLILPLQMTMYAALFSTCHVALCCIWTERQNLACFPNVSFQLPESLWPVTSGEYAAKICVRMTVALYLCSAFLTLLRAASTGHDVCAG